MHRVDKGYGLFSDVETFIKENGPCTVRDIYVAFDYAPPSIRVAVSSLRREHKRVYIKKWVREDDKQYNKAIPQYAYGDKPDAKKPKPLNWQERNERYRLRKRVRVNSVFALGANLDDLRLTTTKRPDVSARFKEKATVA